MKLVSTGMSSRNDRTMSRSIVKHSSSTSETNRRKSGRRAGFDQDRGTSGGVTCSQEVYRWDQKRVYHASLSVSRSPYRRRSQTRKAAAAAGVYAVGPYSLLMCHIASAGWWE